MPYPYNITEDVSSLQRPSLLPSPDSVDQGKLKQGEEYEASADKEPDINNLDIADLDEYHRYNVISFQPCQP